MLFGARSCTSELLKKLLGLVFQLLFKFYPLIHIFQSKICFHFTWSRPWCYIGTLEKRKETFSFLGKQNFEKRERQENEVGLLFALRASTTKFFDQSNYKPRACLTRREKSCQTFDIRWSRKMRSKSSLIWEKLWPHSMLFYLSAAVTTQKRKCWFQQKVRPILYMYYTLLFLNNTKFTIIFLFWLLENRKFCVKKLFRVHIL